MDTRQTAAADGARQQNLTTLAEKLKGIRIAMLTTVDEDGTLRARPMATQEMEPGGALWFFTHASAPKVGDVERDQEVSLSYAKPEDERYVAVTGTAQLVRDKERMRALWKPLLKAWFPQGLDDPDLALLQVTINDAEYWDGPSNAVARLTLIAKKALSGGQGKVEENEKLDLH